MIAGFPGTIDECLNPAVLEKTKIFVWADVVNTKRESITDKHVLIFDNIAKV